MGREANEVKNLGKEANGGGGSDSASIVGSRQTSEALALRWEKAGFFLAHFLALLS